MDTDIRTDEANEPAHAVILDPDELSTYRHALRMRVGQQDQVAAARLALQKEEFFEAAAHDRCAALWADICEIHNLDTEATYKVENSGLVYITTQEE